MFTVKQTRSYPVEFTVASPGAPEFATFHGENAQARAEAYAASLNAADKPKSEGK